MLLSLRRAIAGAGVASLVLSACSFVSEGVIHAAPLLAIRLHLPFTTPQIGAVTASPSPAPDVAVNPPAGPQPAIAASRRRGLFGDGPIVLRGTGQYQLGVNRSTRNGLATGFDTYSTSLTLGIERRTEQTAFSVTSGVGYTGFGINAGSLLIGYRTPTYGLAYGDVTGPSDSQLGIGGFARGVALTLPLRNGDVSLLSSTATQTVGGNSVTSRVYGLRRDLSAFGGFLGIGAYYGAGEQGGARQGIGDVTFRKFGPKVSTSAEVAISGQRGLDGTPPGAQLATALQADIQGKSLFTTLTARFDPNGFATLSGPQDGGFNADLALRKHSERFGDYSLDVGHFDDRSFQAGGGTQHDSHVLVQAGKTTQAFGIQVLGGLTSSFGNGATTLERTGAVTLSENFHKLSFNQTYQAASTSTAGSSAQQHQIALGVSDQLFGGSFGYQFARSGTSASDSSGTGISSLFSFRRAISTKLDVQLQQSFFSSGNNGSVSRLAESGIALTRRISTVVAVQAGAQFFQQSGLGAGRGTIFSASLVGPFGFGQPVTGGRANPRLPAVIRGTVAFATISSAFGAPAQVQRGFNNAVIILDGRVTQRTDSTGSFEFRFVPQGSHTIRIDTATLAPGLIADREYQTVAVLGGQTATVDFSVGNFAAVTGSVYEKDQAGKVTPLPGIGIAVDGVQATVSTADGHYQVGRLTPGPHTVELVEATIPSTVAITTDRKKDVTVTAGAATRADFVATPLGSIGGQVLVPSEGGFGALAGLHNVYVVAEPGEHAGITDDDGAFLLDNLPPGVYTLTVDPDTLPDGLSVLSGPDGPVPLAGGASVNGIVFKLGAKAKEVVMTFSDGKKKAIEVTTAPAVVAPGALLEIRARTAAKDVKEMVAQSDAFGTAVLRPDPRSGAWLGLVTVPQLAKGDYAVTVTANRSDVADGTTLVPVDPAVPLVLARFSPRNAVAGQSVRLTLRVLAQAEEGDTVLFEDGYKVALPKPAGRTFAVDIRIWRKGLPYGGQIVTKRGQALPFVLR